MPASLLKTGARGKLKAHGSNGRNSRVKSEKEMESQRVGDEGGVRRGAKGAKYGSTLTGLDVPRQGAGPRPRLESLICFSEMPQQSS